MVTKSEIEDGLGAYLNEMQRCAAKECNWALAHLVMMMPDICGALESDDGSERRYRTWCELWLECALFNGLERYKERCSLFHQGQTQPDVSRIKGEALRYDRVSFGPSGSPHMHAEGRLLHLDVVKLHADTVRGIGNWAAEMERVQNAKVGPRIAGLARAHPVEEEIPAGLPVLPTPNRMFMPGATEAPFLPYAVVTRIVTS